MTTKRKVLRVLHDLKRATRRELAQLTGRSKSAVDKALHWLERAGLVVITPRKHRGVSLTPLGLLASAQLIAA